VATSAANKPSDLEAQYQGEIRTGHGYQYWTTSEEDEEAEDIRDIVERGEEVPKPKPKKKLLKPGTLRRVGVRLASLLLIGILAAIAWFVFNLVQVYGAADDVTTQPAQAIVVLGAAQNNGTPSGVLRERLDHALDLRENEGLWIDGVPPVIMTTGAGQENETNTEGRAGYDYLISKGLTDDEILVIPEGTNTYEQLSASLFQLEQLDAAAADAFDPEPGDDRTAPDLTPVILVSDGYHNYRLLQIADEVGMSSGERGVYVSPQQIIDPTTMNHVREAAATSIGRILGFRRLSSITDPG